MEQELVREMEARMASKKYLDSDMEDISDNVSLSTVKLLAEDPAEEFLFNSKLDFDGSIDNK